MLPIKRLSGKASATGWLDSGSFASVAALGFAKVINFRPDGETREQISSSVAKAAAEAAGLQYVHVPVTKYELFTDEVVAKAVLEFAGESRVLAYCASGQRAAIVWAAATARSQSVDQVLSSLFDAGFDLGFIRDDLDAQADRARWANAGTGAPGGKSLQGKDALEVAA